VHRARPLREAAAMKASAWKLLLAASLLVNAGVLAAVWMSDSGGAGAIERALFGMRHEDVPAYLGLDAAQRERWHALEAGFVGQLRESAQRIEGHRERMVRELLSAEPDAAAVERERSAIFALQEAQQRAVIGQLEKERDMLRPEQRQALAELLIAQGGGAAGRGAR
jgi:Spy/CpxP family protein refolding chaperone